MKQLVLVIIVMSLMAYLARCDSVCTAKLLIQELKEDLRDNGKLDCLFKPIPARGNENNEERKIRIDGVWDTDCAFQASYDWFGIAKENFGINTGLVDSEGKVVEDQFDNQSDMCELIRSMINADLFEGYNLENLQEDAFDIIECPGPNDQAFQICAASGGSANQKYTWTILIEPSAFTIMKNQIEPSFSLESKSKQILDQRKSQGSLPLS